MTTSRIASALTAVVVAVGLAHAQATNELLPQSATAAHKVKSLHITILSTMLADRGVGEWGFAALVEADGRRLLFDAGYRPETVLENARELGVDLSTVTDVVLSHHHGDHTGGLVTLRRELGKTNPSALSRIHVAPGIFLSRRCPAAAVTGTTNGSCGLMGAEAGGDQEANPTIAMKGELEAGGAAFIEHARATELIPGVWVTGPVPRRYPERNWSPAIRIVTPGGLVPDSVPEDMSLVINTDKGLVVVTGCGHAGIVNIAEYAHDVVASSPVYAVVGGLHLFAAKDDALAWTADKLHAAGLVELLGAHCTGIEAVLRIRQLAGLSRKTAVVGAVGSSFDSGRGIDPLALAQ
ncbi:MAG TPA: MBL fold metallo-hydrolase [Candidatus Dormibacteraeota bacterium]|nr:MBL fold metallo-hydrolase [Candidatus Dormibacteraeota bacterium]